MIDEWGDGDHENRGRVSRVVVTKVDNSGEQQLLDYEGVADEKHTGVLRIQVFGFTNNPPKDSEGILLALNARDAPLLLGVESPKHRPKDDPEGTSRQYDAAGSTVYLDGQGNVTIEFKGKLKIKGAQIELEGAMKFKGNIEHEGDMTSTGVHTDANGVHV